MNPGSMRFQRRFPDVQGVLAQAFLSRFDYLLNLRGNFPGGARSLGGIDTRPVPVPRSSRNSTQAKDTPQESSSR